MSVSGIIAEQLVAEKVARLHAEMRLAAEKCRGLDDARVREVLTREALNREYLDIGLINRDGKILSYGVKPPDYKLTENKNARRALKGETVMSTTQYNNHGDFIMRFWLPLEDGGTLVAESASEAKSHFLANMSHEMRTPLNAITAILRGPAWGLPLPNEWRR